MLRNYFKIALRNFLNNKAFSFINIIGLTLGLSACLIIFQYLSMEYSFDNFHKNEATLYRVTPVIHRAGESSGPSPETGFALAPALTEAVPELQHTARIHPEYDGAIVSNPGNSELVFDEPDIFYADPSFLKMFTFPLLAGSKEKALGPSTMLISESAAEKYFGKENPIGKILQVTGQIEKSYTINGILKDVPGNSHLRFNMLLPMDDLLKGEFYTNEPEGGWSWNNFITYIQLRPYADKTEAELKMTNAYLTHRKEWLREIGMTAQVKLQPLGDIHLNDKIEGPNTVMGSYRTVYFFGIIGLAILFIALINYINLATARSLDRSREVGVRKVIGAKRQQLIIQFLCESVLTNLIAAVLSVMLVELLIPIVNELADAKLVGILLMEPILWIAFLLTLGVCTLLSGLYPAFLLSSFKPVSVLKGKSGSFKTQLWLRRVLVIVQFAASIILIGGTAIVYDQLNYMRRMDLGLDLEKVLTVKGPRVLPKDAQYDLAISVFIRELEKLPAVKETATSASLPGQGFNWNGASIRKTSDAPADAIRGVITYIDTSFMHLYNLKLIAGNGFAGISSLTADSIPWPVIANETAVRSLGFNNPITAIEQQLNIGGYNARIVGVLKDFNWSSAHTARQNIFFVPTIGGDCISLKLNTSDLPGTISSIETIYEKFFPGNVFSYAFAEEQFDEQYKKDLRFANLFTLFAILAILIACLGLFGLAAFTTRQRKKEIGVRKVLGASVPEIVALLSRDFLKLIIAAILIACPIIYLLMSSWLELFAYRVTIGPAIFIFTGIIVLIIAILTVSYQSIRAALHNPVNSLRYE